MGKGLDKFLNLMRLNDDVYEEYDDEFSDDFDDYGEDYDDYDESDESETPKTSKASKTPKKKKTSFRSHKTVSEPEPEPESAPAREYSSRSTASSGTGTRSGSARSNIVPMRQPASRSTGMEVSIQKPASFEDSGEICDELLNGKAAIVNLEGIDVEAAQRIIDFVSGACYAMSGNIRKVSSYIFIVTPAGIDISGDMENVLSASGTSKVDMSAFRLNV